jgi:hypothetical protein
MKLQSITHASELAVSIFRVHVFQDISILKRPYSSGVPNNPYFMGTGGSVFGYKVDRAKAGHLHPNTKVNAWPYATTSLIPS